VFLSISFFLSIRQSVYLSSCFLWFLRLSFGWMISRWMNSVGDLRIYEASTASVKGPSTSTSTSSRVPYHCANITFYQKTEHLIQRTFDHVSVDPLPNYLSIVGDGRFPTGVRREWWGLHRILYETIRREAMVHDRPVVWFYLWPPARHIFPHG
jgi:hypothetical protein